MKKALALSFILFCLMVMVSCTTLPEYQYHSEDWEFRIDMCEGSVFFANGYGIDADGNLVLSGYAKVIEHAFEFGDIEPYILSIKRYEGTVIISDDCYIISEVEE